MKNIIQRVSGSLYAVIGVVLIWRGVWVLLDFVDHWLFGKISITLAIAGLIIGFVLLYLHDHKIDELGHI